MYTRNEKLKAVKLFIKYELSPSAVIHELGYPSKNRLYQWYKEYTETGDLSDSKDRHGKYTRDQRAAAVKYYLEHGRSISKTIQALGYPKKTTLCEWLNEDLEDKYRKWYCKRTGSLVRCSQEQKEKAVKDYCTGEKTPAQIANEYGVSPYTIYRWRDQLLNRKEMKDKPASSLPATVPELQDEVSRLTREADELKRQVHKLQMERDILEKAAEVLKKGAGISLNEFNNREKAELIGALRGKYRLKELLIAVQISKSSYCYQANALEREDKYAELRGKIRDIFEASRETYGYRRVYMELRNQDCVVSEKVVKRIMQEEGLSVKKARIRKYNSYAGEITPAVDNLVNRDFSADAPNKKWLTDITEFHIPAGKVYLSPIIDCFDGAVVSWTIGTSPNADLVNSMLDAAIQTLNCDEKPIVHSDRGAHYRWPGWIEKMTQAGLTRSMSKKGCSPDNSACEGFFGRLKNEMFYFQNWIGVTIEEFMDILDDYIHWYNEKRIKVSLGGRSPFQYRKTLGLVA